jgi:transcriptional regulator with XRE-family HTH domain
MDEKNLQTESSSTLQQRLEKLHLRQSIERGKRLKEERRRLGYSLAGFANMLGIHRNTQGNYEAGRDPPTSYLAAAQKAEVDIAYVVEGERLSGVASHCASVMEKIFTLARSLGLCDLDPEVLAMLAYIVAKNEERVSSGIEGAMDDAQFNLLVDAAFRTPTEFNEAAIAISKYGSRATGEDPSPEDEAAMILETLSIYPERHKLPIAHGVPIRDAIRLIAESVVSSRLPKSN